MFKSTVFSASGAELITTLRNPVSRNVLILVPWLGGSPYIFYHILEHLPADLRVVSFDYRAIERAGMDRSAADIGHFLIEPILELPIDSVSLAGPSLGGILALTLAAKLEQRGVKLGTIVLLDSVLPSAFVPVKVFRILRSAIGKLWPRRRQKPDAEPASTWQLIREMFAMLWRQSPSIPRSGNVVHLEAADQHTGFVNDFMLGCAIPRLARARIAGDHHSILDKVNGPETGRTVARYIVHPALR